MKHNTFRVAARSGIVGIAALLAACGGGGGGGGGTTGGSNFGSTTTPITLTLQATGLASSQSVTVSNGASVPTTFTKDGSAQVQITSTDTLSITQQPTGETCELVMQAPSPFGTQNGTTAPPLTVGTSLPGWQTQNATSPINVDCSTYPAATPPLPQVGPTTSGSPVVMPNPIITPVFFSNDPATAQTQEVTFLQRLVASKLWSNLGEYGVGSATVASPIVLPTAMTASFSRTTTDNLLNTNAATWEGGTLDTNHYFVFFLPNGTTLDVANAGGYHTGTYTLVGSQYVLTPYAVVPLPSDPNNQITTEHEVMEGVADPSGYLGYAAVQSPGGISSFWSAVIADNGDTELGDMCEMYTTSESDLPSYILQPIWSNQAAAAGQNPCMPSSFKSGSSVFGAVVPSQDTTTLTGGAGTFQGILVKAGQSVTIPLQVFSTSPNVGAITLGARVQSFWTAGSASDVTGWTFSFDKQGINGDTVNLTITTPADIGTGIYAIDLTAADNQGDVFSWPLGISTSTTYQ